MPTNRGRASSRSAGGHTESALGGRWHGGFGADAVPGALVGTTTGSVAATRKSRPGIGGDVSGMRGLIEVSRDVR